MMHPENPLIKDMSPEQKRTFLFTSMRPKNEKWISSIKEEIEYYKDRQVSTNVSTYGAPLVINEDVAADLKMTARCYEHYVIPNPDILLSENIPPRFVLDHRDNKDIKYFLRMLMRRDILSSLGFLSSGRNGPIENILWESKQYKDEESGREISYFTAESPNDPKVFLVRTLWPPKEDGGCFVFAENLWVAENKRSAIVAVEAGFSNYLN